MLGLHARTSWEVLRNYFLGIPGAKRAGALPARVSGIAAGSRRGGRVVPGGSATAAAGDLLLRAAGRAPRDPRRQPCAGSLRRYFPPLYQKRGRGAHLRVSL